MTVKATIGIEDMNNGVTDGFIFRDPRGLPFMGPTGYLTASAAMIAAQAAYPAEGNYRGHPIVSATAVGTERLELVLT